MFVFLIITFWGLPLSLFLQQAGSQKFWKAHTHKATPANNPDLPPWSPPPVQADKC